MISRISQMLSMAGYNRLISEETISLGDCYIATKDGEAMVFVDALDLSVYAGTDAGSTPYRLVFTDSVGKTAVAYGGAVGGGEALGVDVFSGFDFTSGWSAANSTINDADTFTNTGGSGGVYKNSFEVGRIYKSQISATESAGTVKVINLAYGNTYCVDGDGAAYQTATHAAAYVKNDGGGVGATTDITALSGEPLTDVPVTGLHLVSSKNGTTRNMASVESGFDPNAIIKIEIYNA